MVVAKLRTLSLIAILTALLSACGGGGGGSDSSDSGATGSGDAASTEQSVQISGYAVKGVVSQGIITAWGVEPDGSLVQLGEPVRTSEAGFYDLSFSTSNELIKLELSSDGNTRMRCDAVDGCQGYGGSGNAAFGEDFWPGPSLKLETIVTINGNDNQPQGHLTPLTTLSTTLFEVMGTTTGWAGFQQAQQEVEAGFGLQPGAVALIPVDITRELPDSLTVAELEAALVNSAFLGLAEQFPVEGVQGAIDAFRQQLLNTGEIADAEADGRPSSESIREYAAIHAYTLADSQDPATTDELLSVADRLYGTPDDIEQPVPKPDETPIADNEQSEPAPEPDSDLQNDPEPAPDAEPATSTAKLTWQAPLTRADGTALTMGEIDQYIVRYGTEPDVAEMTNELVIEDGQAMEHEITGLQDGTWYFALSTVDQNGLQSTWSEVASKEIVQ